VRQAHKNVTLSLPQALLRRFRVYAAARNESVSHLMAEAIHKMVDEDSATSKAKRRFIKRIRNAADQGTGGAIRWTRDELHQR
jgi:metal-responsive CopG/Arc/MetJ family transcriptional regulator